MMPSEAPAGAGTNVRPAGGLLVSGWGGRVILRFPEGSELRATLHWPGGEERFADLNVFFAHTPGCVEHPAHCSGHLRRAQQPPVPAAAS